MEQAVITTLAEKMASMLADKLFQEVSLVIDFKDDFEFICEEVNSINSLLNDARGKTASNSIVNWVDKVQDFLYDAVYLIDEFEDRELNFFNIIIVKYQMGCRIRALKERVKRIHSSAKYLKYVTSVLDADVRLHAFNNAYDFEEQYSRRKPNALLNRCQSYTVGMSVEVKCITKWILEDDGYGVIAVVGMGGLGKSHLVENVFNSPEVRKGFDHLVWLSVSPKFLAKDLLLVTGRQYLKLVEKDDRGHKMSGLSEEELQIRINGHLSEKRCLFVLDDVWHKEAWEKMGLHLSSDRRNKIVVTTRNKDVAEQIGNRQKGTRRIHKMQYLSDDDSWELFRFHANSCTTLPPNPLSEKGIKSNQPSDQEPDQLTSIAYRIVKKCSGLPLAVKTIAASMTRLKMVPNEWESTLHHLNALDRPDEGEGDAALVMHSLRLSYQALPAHLKPCFLYCSAFPPHSQIKSEYLVHVWIAEGFLSTSTRDADAGDAIEVGRSYLNKLINLCMIEISRVVSDGRVKYCRLHDFLHDLALLESSKESKCLLEPGKELKEVPMDKCKGVRRISLIKNEISKISDQTPLPCSGLRTLLLWNNTELKLIPEKFFDNLKYLVVLDLSQTCIDELPTSIGNAKHLKLLNLSETKIKELPESLSGLKHLQYLDVSGCENLSSLHLGIGGHKYMLHLNVKGCKNLKTLPAGISKLIYLRTLKGARVRHESSTATTPDLKWTDLRGLIRLQRLSVTLIDPQYPSASASQSPGSEGRNGLEGTFGGLTDMRTIYFRNTINSDGCLLHLPDDTQRMERLEKVHLCNCVVPTWMFHLQSLMVLVIEGDNTSAEYEGLQKIPNLKKLHLSHNKICTEFPKDFEEPGAFPRLEKLMLEDFISLEKFPSMGKEVMPKLNHLLLKNCSLEKRMPLGLPTRVKVEVLPNKPAPEEGAD